MADESETALAENEVNEDPYLAGFSCYDFLHEVLIRTEVIGYKQMEVTGVFSTSTFPHI